MFTEELGVRSSPVKEIATGRMLPTETAHYRRRASPSRRCQVPLT